LGILRRVYRYIERKIYSNSVARYVLEFLLTKKVNIEGDTIKVPPKASSVEIFEMLRVIPKRKYERCIWDIGAHIGLFSIQVSGMFDKVVAFEPNRENYIYLKENIEKNKIGNINTLNIAVGNKDGESVMFTDPRPGSGIHSLSKDEILKKEEKVEIMTIDSLVKLYDTPDLIKIDVEGAELDIMKGARKTLVDKNIDWLIEVHSKRTGKRRNRIGQHGGRVEKLHEIFKVNNYYVYGFKNGEYTDLGIENDKLPLYWFASKEKI